MLFASSTSSVRRTSPVDLNLGGDTTTTSAVHDRPPFTVGPSTLPIPRFPDVIEPEASVLPPRRNRRPRPPTPEQIEHEEMSALRHLATELHAALRLSEEENLLLKGYSLSSCFLSVTKLLEE